MNVEVFPAGEYPSRAADLIAGLIDDHQGDSVAVGLAGGATPAATYRELAMRAVDWQRVDTFLTDERWVPHDDLGSNGRLAIETLLEATKAELHRPAWAEDMDPHLSALLYEDQLKRLLPDGRPGLVLLGMGGDGHTASLFPETSALAEKQRWYVANFVATLAVWRLTATFPLLWRAHHVVFLVCNAQKALRIKEVLADGSDLPAAMVSREAMGQVWWLLDEPAAGEL